MNPSGTRTRPPRHWLRTLSVLGGSATFAVALLIASAAPGTLAASASAPDPYAWSNGVVLCQFSPAAPAVNVSAVAVGNTGLSMNVSGMSEVEPNGSVVATANLASIAWQVTNASTDDEFDLAFTTTVSLVAPSSGLHVVGSADLRVDFLLPAYDETSSTTLDIVTVTLTVSNWTWQGSADHLAASLGVWVTYPGSERLIASSNPAHMLTGTSTGSAGDLQWLAADTSANVTGGPGGPSSVSASPSLSSVSAESAKMAVSFGSSAASYRWMNYSTQVGVFLPATIAGIPTSYFVAAGAAAVVASLAIAFVTGRLRRRPSDLIYVHEEEP